MNGVDVGLLRCPETGEALEPVTAAEATAAAGELRPIPRRGADATPAGLTSSMLLRADRRRAYPIVDGIPILLVPEALSAEPSAAPVDLADVRYAEAYDERDFYDEVAEREVATVKESDAYRALARHQAEGGVGDFPRPPRLWLDATYEATAQWKAYRHLAPLEGKRCLQIGGKGVAAVKMLVGGAREAWHMTPIVAEARYSRALATALGVEDRLTSLVGIAEELPFADDTFDVAYSSGCVHHTVTGMAFPEIARVLAPGGRFSAFDPWKTPVYDLGIRIFGKREAVHCRPLDPGRVQPIEGAFGWAEVSHHGALTRYPLLLVEKLGLWLRPITVWWIGRVDDALTSLVPPLRRLGSAVTLVAVKR